MNYTTPAEVNSMEQVQKLRDQAALLQQMQQYQAQIQADQQSLSTQQNGPKPTAPFKGKQ
jgi:uncharacterized membrane protein (DUF106 family)